MPLVGPQIHATWRFGQTLSLQVFGLGRNDGNADARDDILAEDFDRERARQNICQLAHGIVTSRLRFRSVVGAEQVGRQDLCQLTLRADTQSSRPLVLDVEASYHHIATKRRRLRRWLGEHERRVRQEIHHFAREHVSGRHARHDGLSLLSRRSSPTTLLICSGRNGLPR
jgi:hypothetical protein